MQKFMNDSNPVRTDVMRFADSYAPLLRIQYVDISKDAENPNPYVRISADANGSTGTKLILLLNIGASASDYTQYQFSAYATGITDPGGIDASPTHTQCTTLGALIAALNAVDGVVAHRLHAPADYSLDTDDFLDISSTALGPLWLETLYKDASEVLTCAWRLGVPSNINGKVGRGRVELVHINSIFTHTSGTFKMSYDPDEEDATKEELLGFNRNLGTTATLTELWNFHEAPIVQKGPILFEIDGSALTASSTAAYLAIAYRSAEH
jgi:hypothetical protein